MVIIQIPGKHAGAILHGKKGEQVKIRSVGRLDKETSELSFLQKIRRQPVDWHVRESWVSSKKEYFALVHGVPEQRTGSIRTGIAGVPGSLMKMMVTETGKHAVTHYAVQETFGGFFGCTGLALRRGGRIRSASTWPP